jgi:O-acetylhomoserine (thiol)-lyase
MKISFALSALIVQVQAQDPDLADKFADKLIDKMVNMLGDHDLHTNLEDTTLGKPGGSTQMKPGASQMHAPGMSTINLPKTYPWPKAAHSVKFINRAEPKPFGGRLPEDATPEKSFSTMCLYAGQEPDPATGSRVQSIHQNTGFVFRDTDDAAAKFNLEAFGPIYTRLGNPTSDAVEKKVAALEGGMAALSCASGHAAQFLTFTNLMQPGDNFISTNKLYGGSVTQFSRQFAQFGWEVRFVDVDDYEAMEKLVDDKTKAFYSESLCNPGGVAVDMEKVAAIAHKHDIPYIVDNTAATPYLCRPFEHGVDIVVHSGTKYLNGHGNAMAGFIVEKGDFDWKKSGKFPILASECESYHGMNFYDVFGKDGPVAEMFGTKGKTGLSFVLAARALALRDTGASMAPMNAFLVSMGIETLALRMERTCANAQAVAEFLDKHPKIESVQYSGLKSNKYYDVAKKICPKGAGGLFTFSVKGGYEAARSVVNDVKMISLVANLGDSRTLIAHPASMMHRQLSEEQQKAAGASPEVVRLTIGIEDAQDIINDLTQALEKVPAPAEAKKEPAAAPTL